jgi:hypothetical protein
MAEEWKDLDGLEKNLDKFKKEWAKLSLEMKPHWKRFFKNPLNLHSYVNLFVESRRISPYLIGHIDSILYPTALISIIYILVSQSILTF